jgi:hypothetical protein
MARPKNHQQHVTNAVSDLLHSVTRLLGSVGEAVQSAGQVLRHGKSADGRSSRQGRPAKSRGPGKGNPKLKSKLKAHWAAMTPKERAARVAKMHAWRNKKPSASTKRGHDVNHSKDSE